MKKRDKFTGLVKTPKHIVNIILDNVGYKGEAILGKTILEPAAGDGNFLIKIVERYIKEGKKKGLSNSVISKDLNNYIYAWELQSELLINAIDKLDLLLDKEDIPNITWKNFKVVNTIIEGNNSDKKFDFIVGNPPYIRVQHLSLTDRAIIKENSTICEKGAMDIYIPFFELGFNLLKKDGKLGFITPNTLLKTKSAKILRDFLLTKTTILKLIDFKEHQVFNATTYSLITILTKKENVNNKNIELYYSDDKFTLNKIGNINLEIQGIGLWNLLPNDSINKIADIEDRDMPLGKVCKISTGLGTLADSTYIHKIINFDQNSNTQTIIVDGSEYKIETSILKPIIKASTLKNDNLDQHLYIIFPYNKNENNKNEIIKEDILSSNYPLTYKYLLSQKGTLLSRDKGKKNKVAWYAFGRTQGLDSSFGKKIITSTMNKKPNFIFIDNEDATFISGYSISIPTNITINNLLNQLNSEDMEFYINNISRDYRGGYKAYSKAFLETFGINLD